MITQMVLLNCRRKIFRFLKFVRIVGISTTNLSVTKSSFMLARRFLIDNDKISIRVFANAYTIYLIRQFTDLNEGTTFMFN